MARQIRVYKQDVVIKSWNRHRVLTMKDIRLIHENSQESVHAFSEYRKRYRALVEGIDFFKLSGPCMKKCDTSLEKGVPQIVITERGYRKLMRVIQVSKTNNPAEVHQEIIDRYYRGDLSDARKCDTNPDGFVGSLLDEKEIPDVEPETDIMPLEEAIPPVDDLTEPEDEAELIRLQKEVNEQTHRQIMERYQTLLDLAGMQPTQEIKDKLTLMAAQVLLEGNEEADGEK